MRRSNGGDAVVDFGSLRPIAVVDFGGLRPIAVADGISTRGGCQGLDMECSNQLKQLRYQNDTVF